MACPIGIALIQKIAIMLDKVKHPETSRLMKEGRVLNKPYEPTYTLKDIRIYGAQFSLDPKVF